MSGSALAPIFDSLKLNVTNCTPPANLLQVVQQVPTVGNHGWNYYEAGGSRYIVVSGFTNRFAFGGFEVGSDIFKFSGAANSNVGSFALVVQASRSKPEP